MSPKKQKSTIQSFSDDIRVIIHDELAAQKSDWIRDITDSVTHALGDKIDKVYEKLDAFIGDIRDKHTTQELHEGQHERINEKLENLDDRMKQIEKRIVSS